MSEQKILSQKGAINEKRIMIFCGLLLIIISICYKGTNTKVDNIFFSTSVGIITGLFAASFLIYMQNKKKLSELNAHYSKYNGTYKRTRIGMHHELAVKPERIEQNVHNSFKIIFKHIPNSHSFDIDAEYWQPFEAKVEANIDFEEIRGRNAIGYYRYVAGTNVITNESLIGHTGTYKMYQIRENKIEFLVLFQHLFPPDGLPLTSQLNSGWEIWERV